MDCDVCIGTEDIDDPFAESSIITDKAAKRTHVCYECRAVIHKGDVHEHAAGRDEYWGDADNQNGWTIYHICNLCVEVRDVFSCGKCYYYGEVWAEMREVVFPQLTTANKCFQALSPRTKSFVMTRWQIWRGL